jgi:hypothetical protein
VDEAVKRLAAAQGIDVLNLVKSMSQVQEEQGQAQQQAQQMELLKQAPNMAKAPLMDPTKNPQMMNELNGQADTNETPEIEQENNIPGGSPFG